LTAETVVAVADCFPTVDLVVLRRIFAAPPASGPPRHHHLRPHRRYPCRPPSTSLTRKTPADDLLEACTCPT
jgi:hypothetical protein